MSRYNLDELHEKAAGELYARKANERDECYRRYYLALDKMCALPYKERAEAKKAVAVAESALNWARFESHNAFYTWLDTQLTEGERC